MILKAVGFDIDGTLYPDWNARVRSVGFFFKNLRPVLAFARTRKRMRSESEQSHMNGNPDDIEVEIFAQELAVGTQTAREIRDRIIYGEWEKIFTVVKIYPDVEDCLHRLKESGLRLAALSDFPVGRKLKYFGLDHFFEVVIGFPESKRLKPRSEPFLEMAEQLKLQPGEILYIGNKLHYDVRGAENAGMRGALIGAPGRKAPKDVTVFRDYIHLADSVLSEVTP